MNGVPVRRRDLVGVAVRPVLLNHFVSKNDPLFIFFFFFFLRAFLGCTRCQSICFLWGIFSTEGVLVRVRYMRGFSLYWYRSRIFMFVCIQIRVCCCSCARKKKIHRVRQALYMHDTE